MPPSVWTAESDIQRSGRLPFRRRPAGVSSCLGVAPSLSRLRARVSRGRLQLRKNCLAAGGCDCPPRNIGRYCCRFGSNRGLESCLPDGTESHGRRSVWSLDHIPGPSLPQRDSACATRRGGPIILDRCPAAEDVRPPAEVRRRPPAAARPPAEVRRCPQPSLRSPAEVRRHPGISRR